MVRKPELTDAHCLAFLAGVPLQEARQGLAERDRMAAGAAASRAGESQTTLADFIENGRLKPFSKVSPNEVTQKQAEQLPGVLASKAGRVAQGRPYFSLDEFAAVTGASKSVLTPLIKAPRYERVDKTCGSCVAYEPEPNLYVSELPTFGFEAAEQGLQDTGYVIQRTLTSKRSRLAVIGRADFQAGLGGTDRLKQAVGGRLIPAVRDPDGKLRYFAPRRIDLWFVDTTPATTAAACIASLGLVPRPEASPRLAEVGFYPCEMPSWPEGDPFAAMLETIERAQACQEIRFAEPDEIGVGDFPMDRPSAPAVASEFEDAGRFWNHDICGLPATHTITRGSAEVTVIIIDSGIAISHPDFASALREDWRGLDLAFATEEPDTVTSPDSSVPHGTRVGSIAIGSGGPDAVQGVAPGCRLLPFRISGDATTAGYGMRAAAMLHALKLIGANRRAVMNLSWGMAGDHTGVRMAIEATTASNVVVTMSAGNYLPGEAQTANQLHYPSSYCRDFNNVLSVAAVNDRRRKASYSYYGSDTVSLCAPGGEAGGSGVGLYSASPPAGHDYTFGTSFSVVHACGTAALMLSVNPALAADKVAQILKTSGQALKSDEPLAGHLGRLLDAAAALARAKAEPVAVPPVTPAASNPSNGMQNRPISVNNGTKAQLVTVPSLSADRADAIISDRTQKGPYPSLWDLRRTGVITTFIIGYWEQGGWLAVD